MKTSTKTQRPKVTDTTASDAKLTHIAVIASSHIEKIRTLEAQQRAVIDQFLPQANEMRLRANVATNEVGDVGNELNLVALQAMVGLAPTDGAGSYADLQARFEASQKKRDQIKKEHTDVFSKAHTQTAALSQQIKAEYTLLLARVTNLPPDIAEKITIAAHPAVNPLDEYAPSS